LVACISGMSGSAISCTTAGPFVSAAACDIARKAVEKKFPSAGVCVAQDPKTDAPPPPKGG
jgi:hypothetical protein